MVLWEKYLNVSTAFQIIPAKTGKVFCNNCINLPFLNVGYHSLKIRSVEVRSRISVIYIKSIGNLTHFPCVFLKDCFLTLDTHALSHISIVL